MVAIHLPSGGARRRVVATGTRRDPPRREPGPRDAGPRGLAARVRSASTFDPSDPSNEREETIRSASRGSIGSSLASSPRFSVGVVDVVAGRGAARQRAALWRCSLCSARRSRLRRREGGRTGGERSRRHGARLGASGSPAREVRAGRAGRGREEGGEARGAPDLRAQSRPRERNCWSGSRSGRRPSGVGSIDRTRAGRTSDE